MVKSVIWISSNSINLGCASISMNLEDLLNKYNYKCIHFTSNNSYNFIKKNNRKVYKINGISEIFSARDINMLDTILINVKDTLNFLIHSFWEIKKQMNKIIKLYGKPVIHISVYESYSSYVVNHFNIPVLEISDMLFFHKQYYKKHNNCCEIIYLLGLYFNMSKYNYGLAICLNKKNYDNNKYKNVKLIEPPLSNDILKYKQNSEKIYVSVYVSGVRNKEKWLYNKLKLIKNHNFIVFVPYTEDIPKNSKNVTYYRVDKKLFTNILNKSYAIINNSGLTTSYEAIYLGVKIFAIPTANHFGQNMVCDMIQNNDYGVCFKYYDKKGQIQKNNIFNKLKIFLDNSKKNFNKYSNNINIEENEQIIINTINKCKNLKITCNSNFLYLIIFILFIYYIYHTYNKKYK